MRLNNHILTTGALVAVGRVGCGPSAGSQAPSVPHVANPNADVLQFAVGTANIYGTTGLNVVTTFRQPKGALAPGDSAVLVSSPTLTIAGALPATAGAPPSGSDGDSTIDTGPAPSEVGGTNMTSSSQVVGTTTVTTFGQSGGVFGLGIEPFNYNVNGAPDNVAPYPVPVYDATALDPNQIPAAWGGPPAFDLLGNGTSPVGNGGEPGGTAGLSMGLDVFQGVTPVAGGAYSLSVSIPANTGTFTKTASFTLPAVTTLGTFTTPVATQDVANDGGATFAVTLPAGVTEAYVEVADFGPGGTTAASCNGSSAASPVFYTLEVTASGTATLGPAAGPGATPSLCSASQNTTTNTAATNGDQFVVWGIGFDYPAFESSYPNSNGNPAPAILGAGGSDDLTISLAGCYEEATATPTTTGACPAGTLPLLHSRRKGALHLRGGSIMPTSVRRS